jgi:hypothetical protein
MLTKKKPTGRGFLKKFNGLKVKEAEKNRDQGQMQSQMPQARRHQLERFILEG